jgi:hypothetical protein
VRTERMNTAHDRDREGAGAGLSGRYGNGPAWNNLNSTLGDLDNELDTLSKEYKTHHKENMDELSRVATERNAARSLAVQSQAHSYMARARALERLAGESAELRQDRRMLFAFLVTLELIPLVVKAFIVNGPYAKRIALKEWLADEATQIEYEAFISVRPVRTDLRKTKITSDALDSAM